jgi:hypothetical protein
MGVAIMADRRLVGYSGVLSTRSITGLTQAKLWVADAVCGPEP